MADAKARTVSEPEINSWGCSSGSNAYLFSLARMKKSAVFLERLAILSTDMCHTALNDVFNRKSGNYITSLGNGLNLFIIFTGIENQMKGKDTNLFDNKCGFPV